MREWIGWFMTCAGLILGIMIWAWDFTLFV